MTARGFRLRNAALAALACAVAVLPAAASGQSGQDGLTGLIAFESPDGLWLIRPDGTGLRRLPGTRPGDQNPRWSPDGRRLVFWTDAAAVGEIYVARADGSGRRKLTRGPERERVDQFPAWSPDGRLIAFERVFSDTHIWLMRPDGSERRRLTPYEWGGSSPDWAPDGTRIVYTTWRLGIYSLALVNTAGKARWLETLEGGGDWAPAWSPDGSQVAFASTYDDDKPEIHVLDVASGAVERLTRNDAGDFDPYWSPDGEHILFTTSRTGLDELYVMRADGSGQRRLTRFPTEYACCGDWRAEP